MKKELIEKLKKFYPVKAGKKSVKVNVSKITTDTRFTREEVRDVLESLLGKDQAIWFSFKADYNYELKSYLEENGIKLEKIKYLDVVNDPEYGITANIIVESNDGKNVMKTLIDIIEEFRTSDDKQIDCMNIKQVQIED